MSKGKEFPQSEGCDRHWRFIPSCEDCFAPQPASENFPEPPVVEPAPPPAILGDEERAHIHTLDHPCRDTCSGWKQGYEKGLRTSRAELLAEREKVRRLRGAMNEIDIVMNWNADVCCRCFTTEHPKRNPNCQYHRVEEITREALEETE